MKRLLLASAIVAALPSAALAFSGNDLYSDCSTERTSDTFHQSDATCRAYVNGVTHGLRLSRIVCRPSKNVTWRQTQDIVVKYLRENPAVRHRHARILVRDALLATGWRCNR